MGAGSSPRYRCIQFRGFRVPTAPVFGFTFPVAL